VALFDRNTQPIIGNNQQVNLKSMLQNFITNSTGEKLLNPAYHIYASYNPGSMIRISPSIYLPINGFNVTLMGVSMTGTGVSIAGISRTFYSSNNRDKKTQLIKLRKKSRSRLF